MDVPVVVAIADLPRVMTALRPSVPSDGRDRVVREQQALRVDARADLGQAPVVARLEHRPVSVGISAKLRKLRSRPQGAMASTTPATAASRTSAVAGGISIPIAKTRKPPSMPAEGARAVRDARRGRRPTCRTSDDRSGDPEPGPATATRASTASRGNSSIRQPLPAYGTGSGGSMWRVGQLRRRQLGEGVDLGLELAQGREQATRLGLVGEDRGLHDDELAPAHSVGQVGKRRHLQEPSHRGDLVGDVAGPLGPPGEHARCLVPRPDEPAGVHRLDGVEAELDRRDDPEAAAAAAEGPEQVGLRLRVGAHHLAGGRHELEGRDRVARQPVAAAEPAHAAAEGIAHDADVRGGAVEGGEPVLGRSAAGRPSRVRPPPRGPSGRARQP